jgi:potassium efflux system protein
MTRHLHLAILFILTLLNSVDSLHAQGSLTPEDIEKRISTLEKGGSAVLNEDQLATTIATYQEALTSANERKVWLSKAAAYQRKIDDTARQKQKVEAVANSLTTDLSPPDTVDDLTLEELSQTFESIKSQLAQERADSQTRVTEEQTRNLRSEQIPGLIEKRKASLAELISAAEAADDSEASRAESTRVATRSDLLQQQIKTYEIELQQIASTAEISREQSNLSEQKLAVLSKAAEAWQKIVDKRRLKTTGDTADRVRKGVDQFDENPEAKILALQNAELAESHGGENGLSRKMAIASKNLIKREALNQNTINQHASAKKRVQLLEAANLQIDPTTGQLLRQQRQKLPTQRDLRNQLRDALRDSAQAQIDLINAEEQLTQVSADLASTKKAPPEITQLRQERVVLLKNLIDDYREHIATLTASTSALRSLTSETAAFTLFVNERLLWTPSTDPITLTETQFEAQAIYDLFAKDPFKELRADFAESRALWIIVILFTSILLIRRKQWLAHLSTVGSEAQKRNCTSYSPTIKALAYTLLLSLPLPLLIAFIYSRSVDLPAGVSLGIRNCSGFLLFTLTLWHIAHKKGLMVDHFRMSEKRVSLIRKNFRWFVPIMLPLIFFTTALPVEAAKLTTKLYAPFAGRLFFIGSLITLLTLFLRLLPPAKGLIHWRGKPDHKFAKISYLLSIAAPILLIIGAATGYYASVSELRMQALITMWIILITIFIAALMHRWILVSRRRLAVQQALKRRAAALAERQKATLDPGKNPQDIASPDEVKAEAVKVVEVEEQTTRLVRAAAIAFILFALWGVWSPTIPALSALDRVTIWQDQTVQPPSPNADEETEATSTKKSDLPANPITDIAKGTTTTITKAISADGRVTLQDLIASVITVLLTFVAANNIPGLLELTIFRRLKLQPGSSFALTTTIRYILVVAGIVIALGLLNITWGKVQWIAAAITLGIGFGLQEIFANFVAGLIILFERPVRLGDVVTVGDVSGRVTQIRIRATTIRQFNNRELIVPNKEFITGQLVNWTLSDSILRFEIPVGIAYGSDTEKARTTLLDIAHSHPKILKDPAPDVIFDTFGDSALGFILRANVSSVEDLVLVKNELHFTIDNAFREAKIEIAFPQTDIHIRTIPPTVQKSE